MEIIGREKNKAEFERLSYKSFPLKEIIPMEEYIPIKQKIFAGEFEEAERMIDEIIKEHADNFEQIKTTHFLKMLNQCKSDFTRQEYRTFRGQMLAGDVDGAIKGMNRLMRKKGRG